MKLLLTNHELDAARGGTQIFIMDLAQELKARGHEVAVYTPSPGPLAEELAASGVPVVKTPRECGFVPEVIHGQHHLTAMTALCAFPGVPAIYHCHGYNPWEERPPAHPRIRRYVVMAAAMTKWTAGVVHRNAEEIVALPNTVHLGRFQRVRTPGLHPRHALVFGNSFIPGEHLSKLRKACARCGITLDLLGAAYGNPSKAPQDILPDYDVVFATGRCALEAIASGCAVIPFSAIGVLPMVQPDTLKYYVMGNFSISESLQPLTVDMLVKYLQQFDGGHAAAVTSAVRSEANFGKTCDRLEDLYLQVKGEKASDDAASVDEMSAVAVYLESLSSRVGNVDQRYAELLLTRQQAQFNVGKLKNRLVTRDQKLADSEKRIAVLSEKLTALDKRWQLLKRRLPGVIRRWLLRGLE